MRRSVLRMRLWLSRKKTLLTCAVSMFILISVVYTQYGVELITYVGSLYNTYQGSSENSRIYQQQLDEVMHRHQQVKERCTTRKTSNHLPKFRDSPLISTVHEPKAFYCPLAKAGSTFFTRYFIAMDKPGTMTSPFNIRIEDAKRSDVHSFHSLESDEQKINYLNQSFKFVFGRNPYWRIFSSYVDKLYSPNPYYWKAWGERAVTLNHLQPSDHKCGTGVSFSDFVKLVAKELYKKDLHFIPMVDMCKMCEVDWDMVGWVEHSLTDIDYLSIKLNVNASFQHGRDYKMASALDVIHDSTKDSLNTWISDINKCMSMYDVFRIIWRKLQIRGVIYKDIPLPFTEQDVTSLTPERFQRECKKAAERSTDKAKLKKQKEDSFKEAYSLVESQDLGRIKKIYMDDFYIFGYDSQPPSMFREEMAQTDSSIFNWRKDWPS